MTDDRSDTRNEPRGGSGNGFMLEKIRSAPVQPYQEGRYVLRVLVTTGRVSGARRPVPIAVIQLDDRRYVCAPNRGRDWVRNLLAAGECEIEGDPGAKYQAVLVEDAGAARVVARYLDLLDRWSSEWPFPAGAGVPEIEPHTREFAVFRLT
ncbi:MAG TPA: nitroreductase family deazaflavin-dependent oxidoreductase [Amycolatopsis sp.]|jgi:deazaflavin-dependent oxidoreductase (nitroreductase family)|nr:nitroreductase family deazaflavin-dependent oxidoreductase [Amycolatopsis sp.]